MRSRLIVLGLIMHGGCGFSSSVGSGDGAMPGIDACVSFASQVDTCQLVFTGDLVLSGSPLVYDTGMHELTAGGTTVPVSHMILATKEGNVDAIVAHNVRLMGGVELRAIGTLPFGIVASGSVTLEAGSAINVGAGGAGALSVCSSSPSPGANSTGGGGGGGGAGYGNAGGNGGPGDSDGTPSQGGTKSGSVTIPAGPRGGCPGAAGGAGKAAGGLGGLGGGALYIAAADRIEFLGGTAALTAGGGGGRGGVHAGSNGDGGGGGGGSGGMIFLESPHVLGANGRVAANGGGGGGGSTTTNPGQDGSPGTISENLTGGGVGGLPDASSGGRGGSLVGLAGESVTMLPKSGGGGGGGGVGYVRILSADVQLALVSPAAL